MSGRNLFSDTGSLLSLLDENDDVLVLGEGGTGVITKRQLELAVTMLSLQTLLALIGSSIIVYLVFFLKRSSCSVYRFHWTIHLHCVTYK